MPLTSGLKAESGVLHRDSGVTAEQESHETNLEQDEDRHEPRFLVSTALRVNLVTGRQTIANLNNRLLACGRVRQ
jgi:hypothetical protein